MRIAAVAASRPPRFCRSELAREKLSPEHNAWVCRFASKLAPTEHRLPHLLHDFFWNLAVEVHVLHVVQVFEHVDQLEHLLRHFQLTQLDGD